MDDLRFRLSFYVGDKKEIFGKSALKINSKGF